MGRPKKNNLGFFSFLKPIFTVAVLTAFVMGISLLVKTLATSDSETFGKNLVTSLTPILEKLNINDIRMSSVAGAFTSKTSGSVPTTDTASASTLAAEAKREVTPDAEVDFKIALFADSHGQYDNLGKALTQVKELGIHELFFLGDYTDLGLTEDLKNAKSVMDKSGLDYVSLPGDHDLWKSVGPDNFISVFGKNYFSKTINGVKFVGLDNSANYTLISDTQMAWFKNELTNADFVVLSQPLFHPNSGRVMGILDGKTDENVHAQALELLKMIRESKVKAIIAGDLHMSSQNRDPEEPRLLHVVIGAITSERNLQTPRFALFKHLKNGSGTSDYVIEDVLIK